MELMLINNTTNDNGHLVSAQCSIVNQAVRSAAAATVISIEEEQQVLFNSPIHFFNKQAVAA